MTNNAFWLRICCFAFLAVYSLTPSYSQGPAFTISGRVTLPNGNAAPHVVIKLQSMGGLDRETRCDDMGRYEFRDVPRGHYSITVTNPAEPQQFTEPIEVDTSRSISGRIQANIFLRVPPSTRSEEAPKAGTVSVAEATQHVPKEPRKAFEQAIKFKSNRQPDKALASLSRSIQLFPEYFQALAERGHLLIALGRFDEASKDFARALQINNRYGPALRGSGLCKFQQSKFNEAIQDLELAASVEPEVASTYLFLGIAQLALDHREPARQALQHSLTLDPNGASRAHVHLADLYIRENRSIEAIAELQAYLTAVPNAPDADKWRGIETQLRARMKR
ncbi:MAG TPA: tetratricopeptide repeat protein [Acidobacteriota bacterium]|nr:tetratricopeptide repeat protein [Acidobacteriota bacterium]